MWPSSPAKIVLKPCFATHGTLARLLVGYQIGGMGAWSGFISIGTVS
jgi:hypothetical protein